MKFYFKIIARIFPAGNPNSGPRPASFDITLQKMSDQSRMLKYM